MTLEEIKNGESKNVEFKVQLPDDSKKYMKTIVAYANTSGGKIIIGVDDITRNVVGVEPSSVFRIRDRIVNAVSDMCVPQIIPDVTFQTIEELESPEITQDKMAEIMGMSKNGIRYAMNKLKNRGILVRVGATKKGKWFIQQSSLGTDQEEYVISE